MLVQRQIGDQCLQLPVFLPKLPQFPQLAQAQSCVPSLPAVEGLLRHPKIAADVRHLLAGFGFAQGADNLFLGVTFPRHSSSPRFRSEDHIRAADSTFRLSRFSVLGQNREEGRQGLGPGVRDVLHHDRTGDEKRDNRNQRSTLRETERRH
jgi:hypothetical protein